MNLEKQKSLDNILRQVMSQAFQFGLQTIELD